MIVTPAGKIAQYYYGVEFSPKDIRLGLIEASRDNIGNVVDQVLLYCYHYDPKTGRYGAVITNIMRLAGAATMLILGGFHRRDVPPRFARRQPGNRTGLIDMWQNFPLFPPRASALAWQVDGLYFLLVASVGIFYGADFRPDLCFRDEVPPRSASASRCRLKARCRWS